VSGEKVMKEMGKKRGKKCKKMKKAKSRVENG
jgi:hypothetical protein